MQAITTAELPSRISHDKVLVIFGGLLLVMLLAALDSTIVATALPTMLWRAENISQSCGPNGRRRSGKMSPRSFVASHANSFLKLSHKVLCLFVTSD
jgi:hypothetical protein